MNREDVVHQLAPHPGLDRNSKARGQHWRAQRSRHYRVKELLESLTPAHLAALAKEHGMLCVRPAFPNLKSREGEQMVAVPASFLSSKERDVRLAEDHGMVLVPREPTDKAIRAVDAACFEHWPNAKKMAVGMYRAMIAASEGGDDQS